MAMSRRRFLKLGAFAIAASAALPVMASIRVPLASERRLSFYNTHTGEKLQAVYWEEGRYIPEVLTRINHLLRDHRSGEAKAIDPLLLDQLYAANHMLKSSQPFHVISGYRSPQTNAVLTRNSSGVARRSLHMEGKAIDIFLPDRDLKALHRTALALGGGGVGYYPNSNFVHMDTGPLRRW